MKRSAWLLLVILTACGPGYVNIPANNLSTTGQRGVLNSNPQTESFLAPAVISVGDITPPLEPLSGEMPAPAGATTAQATTAHATTAQATTAQATIAEPTTRPQPIDGPVFVGLAISGGGSRSANFAAACMFQLQRLGILQRVDCISAVSGGTLPAAYYCSCTDSDWSPQVVQSKFTHAFASDTLVHALLPTNLVSLLFGNLTRTDLLADNFRPVLFERGGRSLTFGDLRTDRPRLMINCTNLESGERFTFDNATFNRLNSKLDAYPLAYAVTASSAVPIIMHPVPLRDFSTRFSQFCHLLDGGVSDNLGVQSLVNSYEAQIHQPTNPFPGGAVLIVIDAGTPYNSRFQNKAILSLVDSVFEGLDFSSTVLVNRASSATLSEVIVMHSLGSYTASELRGFILRLRTDHFVTIRDSMGNPVRVVHLSLAQVGDLSNATFGLEVNSISTNFDIGQTEAYNLYKAADILFSERFDNVFSKMKQDLSWR